MKSKYIVKGVMLGFVVLLASTQVTSAQSDSQASSDVVRITVASDEIPDMPNIIVIYTDDQRWDTIGSIGVNAEIKKQFGRPIMPHLENHLVKHGVLFTNSFVTTPLCCPSRASILSGGFYAHNTGVSSNKLPNGGAGKFKDIETLSTLLQENGYETALIGKYMNEYDPMAPYIPPGWTKFVVPIEKKSWFDYKVIVGSSRISSVGIVENHTQYLTDFLRDQSLQFIDQHSDSPFFLFLSTPAPHNPATPAPGDEDLFPDYEWRGRAYGEHDLSDKPSWVKKEELKFEGRVAKGDKFHGKQLGSLQAVDRAIGAIVDKIEAIGKLDQTVFIFTSDNGFTWGEHKLFEKATPYEESIRVPLVVRMPGITHRTDSHLVPTNLDIAATIFDLAGIKKENDGQSLVPLLKDPNVSWRKEFLIESSVHSFSGLRTEEWKYVEYTKGEKELYDLVNDPYEEESKHNNPAYQNIMQEFHDRLEPQKGIAILTIGKAPYMEKNKDYQLQLTALGSEKPYSWSIVNGQLPQGLSLNNSSGLISGTPIKAERQKVSIKVEGSSIATQAGEFQSRIREFKFATRSEAALTHGPMVGAVTDSSAQVWFRIKPRANVRVEYATDPDFDDGSIKSERVTTNANNDYTGTITLVNLAADTIYYYKILIQGDDHTPIPQPEFKTFPIGAISAKIGIMTDLRLNTLAEAPAMKALSAEDPDFVILLGDWDNRKPLDLTAMRRMHRKVRGDRKVSGVTFRENILYKFPVAHVWDNHDYSGNNADKTFDKKDEAIQAYNEYWPTYQRPNTQAGIWHKFNYGNLVEVFMLDLRSQRDVNTYNDPDYVRNGGIKSRDELRNDPCRSMLDGDECPENNPKGQKEWLKDGLLNSEATWKVIASTVPWNPTTPKDDAWWDFKAEQDELLKFIRDNNIDGVIVVSGDIHTGGGIDNGINAGIPEMNVPSTNFTDEGTNCRLRKPSQKLGCGVWSEGFIGDGTGYGLITLSPTSAYIEAKDKVGNVVPEVTPLSLSL